MPSYHPWRMCHWKILPGNPSREKNNWEILQFESSMMCFFFEIIYSKRKVQQTCFALRSLSLLASHRCLPAFTAENPKGATRQGKLGEEVPAIGRISLVCVCVNFLVAMHQFKKFVFLFTLLKQHNTTVLRHSWQACSKPFFFVPLVSTPVFAQRFLTAH